MSGDIARLRRAWILAGPFRTRVALAAAYRLMQSLMLGLAFATAAQTVILVAQGAVTPALIWQVTAVMVLSLAGQLAFGYLSVAQAWTASFDLAAHLRHRVLDHLAHLPQGFHDARHNGDTVTSLTTDMQMLAAFFSDGLPRIAQAAGLPLAILVAMAWRDPWTALAATVSVVLAVPVFMLTSRRLSRLGLHRQDVQAEAGARMIEFVQGMAVIRAFNRLPEGQRGLRRAIDDFRDVSIRMVLQLALPMAVFGMVLMLGVPLVLWVLGAPDRDPLTAVAVALLLLTAYAPLLGLLGVMEATRMAEASLARIDRILATDCPTPPAPAPMQGFDLRFEGVSFDYGHGPVLQDISFTVPERSMTAIVGPSGAGKSTILNLIAGIRYPSAGRITVGGVPLDSADAPVSMVFQHAFLFSGTIRDNIAIGRPDADRHQVNDAARQALAHDFIASLPDGYETQVGEGGTKLSGGERQRIAIARAILKDAPIVLLDEATAAIDPINERAITDALAQLVKGRTLVVVAHRLSTIRSADQIIVLDRGCLVAQGTHDALMERNSLYHRMWRLWSRVAEWKVGV